MRPADPADSAHLASAHVAAWQAAYRGMMPQEYLDGLDLARWTTGWQRLLATGRDDATLLVATVDDDVAGFTWFGRARDAESGEEGELFALNVHPDHWGVGAGSALLAAAHRGLADVGHAEAILWVVPGNLRARAFYERHGWVAESVERTAEINGITVPEVRYARELRPARS